MTTYALVAGGQIVAFGLPTSARRLDNGAWVLNLADAPESLRAACGYLPVAEAARPADTATTTTDRTVQLVGGVPSETWTPRPKTSAELTADTVQTNRADIETKARNAIATNSAFLALGAPTNTQTLAQVRALTRECTAIIRLLIGADLLTDTEGT